MADEYKPQKNWGELARQAADENDGEKLTRLTNKLIEALDAKLKKLISLVEDDKRKP